MRDDTTGGTRFGSIPHTIRLLRCALLLRRFTVADLCSRTGLQKKVVENWLEHNAMHVQKIPGRPDMMSREQPPDSWIITDAGRGPLLTELERWRPRPEVMPEDDDNMAGLVQLLEQIEQIEDRYLEMAEDQREAARVRLRIAWEGCAEADGVGYEVPTTRLKLLAEIEAYLGFAKPFPDVSLHETAERLVEQIKQISACDWVSAQFAARVIRARATRTPTIAARLTAAAYAARVWADELDTLEPTSSANPAQLCSYVLDDVPLADRLEHVLIVLGREPTTSEEVLRPEERQAVVLGVADAADVHQKPPPEIVNWLISLPTKTIWSDELAPAVIRGALAAPHMQLISMIAAVGGSVERAMKETLDLPGGRIGKLRKDAYQLSKEFLHARPRGTESLQETHLGEFPAIYGSYKQVGT